MEGAVAAAFDEAKANQGDLGLAPERYEARLRRLVSRQITGGDSGSRAPEVVRRLHTSDLYLTFACAEKEPRAWNRFVESYRPYLLALARPFFKGYDAAEELAEDTLVALYLPDASGGSRIGSFHGRSTLATWLRAVVGHRALNRRRHRGSQTQCLDSLPDIPDAPSFERIESGLRCDRYGVIIRRAIRRACADLGERDRLILLLRYEQCLPLRRIGQILELHTSTVCRRLERTHRRLRQQIIDRLGSGFCLEPAAIEECLAEIREAPEYDVLLYLKELETEGSTEPWCDGRDLQDDTPSRGCGAGGAGRR